MSISLLKAVVPLAAPGLWGGHYDLDRDIMPDWWKPHEDMRKTWDDDDENGRREHNGWTIIFHESDEVPDHGLDQDYCPVTAFMKGEAIVWVINESQYESDGVVDLTAFAKTKEELNAFLSEVCEDPSAEIQENYPLTWWC